MVEELVEFLIGIVDTQLLKTVHLKNRDLITYYVYPSTPFLIILSMEDYHYQVHILWPQTNSSSGINGRSKMAIEIIFPNKKVRIPRFVHSDRDLSHFMRKPTV